MSISMTLSSSQKPIIFGTQNPQIFSVIPYSASLKYVSRSFW